MLGFGAPTAGPRREQRHESIGDSPAAGPSEGIVVELDRVERRPDPLEWANKQLLAWSSGGTFAVFNAWVLALAGPAHPEVETLLYAAAAALGALGLVFLTVAGVFWFKRIGFAAGDDSGPGATD